MTRRIVAAALIAALALPLAACPRRGPGGGETPVPGGTLRVSIRDLGTLDPAKATGRGALTVVSQLFDSLTTVDPANNALLPAAASSWSASRDGLTWRFNIARARYHDGRAVTPADFKFAFDRVARKATRSDAAFQLEQIRGFRDVHLTGKRRSLSGVIAQRRTLIIKLERPFAELPYVLAHPALAPLGARYRSSTTSLRRRPVGNGPFKLRAAAIATSARLVRFDAYHGPTALLDGIDFAVSRSLDAGWRAFRAERTDVADVPAAELAAGTAALGQGGFTPVWATLSFGPNLARAIYRKPEVRRAMSLAIDRKAIASSVYGNTKDAATGILPRGVRGYLPDSCAACLLDQERARQIVRAAFGRRPPTIRIDHLNDESSRRVARAIAKDLQRVGLRASLRAHTPSRYLRLLQNGDHDFAQLGWLADVPSPDGFLAQQLRTGSPNNQTGFKDARFDAAIEVARKERNDGKRLEAYRKAELRALQLMPLIPVVFFRNRTAVARDVRGFVLDGAGVFQGAGVWLAREGS